jgi:hypothetical protein
VLLRQVKHKQTTTQAAQNTEHRTASKRKRTSKRTKHKAQSTKQQRQQHPAARAAVDRWTFEDVCSMLCSMFGRPRLATIVTRLFASASSGTTYYVYPQRRHQYIPKQEP